MKKSIAVLIVAAMVLSSCSFYTCPTYAKNAKTSERKSTRI